MADADIGRARVCAQCSNGFVQTGKGRARLSCYSCAPFRPDQRPGKRKSPKPCLGCSCPLPSAKIKRCAPCTRVHLLAYHRERWASTPKWNRPTGSCAVCGDGFTPHVPTQRYCSPRCRSRADSRCGSDARPLYALARWRAIRAEQLRVEPSCRFCKEDGTETPATVCDHVEPHRGSVEAFWSGPFQSLCVGCHNGTKQRMERLAA